MRKPKKSIYIIASIIIALGAGIGTYLYQRYKYKKLIKLYKPLCDVTPEDMQKLPEEIVFNTIGKSMLPVITEKSTIYATRIKNYEDLQVGDIVSFIIKFPELNKYCEYIHRIIAKGYDSEGLYFITKGDNNWFNDGKIRPEQIFFIVTKIE